MFKIDEKGPLDRLRILSVKLQGDFKEGHNTAAMKLKNTNGAGTIFIYEMMPGLYMTSYNIIFGEDINFRVGGGSLSPILMIYCLDGHFYHDLKEGDLPQIVPSGRNIILSPAKNEMNSITIPGDTAIKICMIAIERSEIPSKDLIKRDGLKLILKDLYSKTGSSGYLENFVGVRSKVDDYSRILIENRRTDVVGKLLTEAAVLNMMAEQLDAQEKNSANQFEISPLTNKEFDRLLLSVSNMRKSLEKRHTIKLFSSRTAISPKKIQDGFRFLFDHSFASFLKNLRLETARELLETTDLPIIDIAYSVGISSKSHLAKIFREKFGMLPRNYRHSLIDAFRSFELSYRSKASLKVGESDVQAIVESANKKNIRIDVSGCLVYYEDYFFQILEGPKQKVLEIFETISTDSRHEEIETLWKGPRDNRVFPENGMVLLSDREISKKLSSGRNLSVDMATLVDDKSKMSVGSRMFWERIRNRLLVSNVA